jgi:hypothetical protein
MVVLGGKESQLFNEGRLLHTALLLLIASGLLLLLLLYIGVDMGKVGQQAIELAHVARLPQLIARGRLKAIASIIRMPVTPYDEDLSLELLFEQLDQLNMNKGKVYCV